MKKFKKILSMVLTLAISMSFLCGTTVWAATTDEDVGQVSVPYNAEITNGIVKNSPDVATHNADISDPQDITIQLAKDTSGSIQRQVHSQLHLIRRNTLCAETF